MTKNPELQESDNTHESKSIDEKAQVIPTHTERYPSKESTDISEINSILLSGRDCMDVQNDINRLDEEGDSSSEASHAVCLREDYKVVLRKRQDVLQKPSLRYVSQNISKDLPVLEKRWKENSLSE
ncbi:unnamed protein product [Lepeophtheirus salmonis]|uniref:(salmon louse) hypothetical protein n=1 Tax=Lepeophtheirus salmonis TaxID=72036 RepID=A0A7R8D2X1_LEPSM|nr:unnamed protein product [Lepeophtheirus salmonis]CAF3009429.1 unnamed protein product [Lepeophtheirus salmonis]